MNTIDPNKLSDALGHRYKKRKIAAFQFANKKVCLYEVWGLEYENGVATATVAYYAEYKLPGQRNYFYRAGTFAEGMDHFNQWVAESKV